MGFSLQGTAPALIPAEPGGGTWGGDQGILEVLECVAFIMGTDCTRPVGSVGWQIWVGVFCPQSALLPPGFCGQSQVRLRGGDFSGWGFSLPVALRKGSFTL